MRYGRRMRALVLASCTLVMTMGSSCITATRWIEVHLEDTERVDVDAPEHAKVKRTKTDVKVDGRSVLAQGSWIGRNKPTMVRRVEDAPDALALEHGQLTWNRGNDVAMKTPRANIRSAELATMWSEPFGTLPSMGAVAAGGVFALGFGVAGAATLSEGIANGDQRSLLEGAGFCAGAAAGAALVTYGVITYVLVDTSPRYEPLPISE